MNELTQEIFDYNELDNKTLLELKNIENEIDKQTDSYGTFLGKKLLEAQQLLSKNGYGCFEKWCVQKFKLEKDKVYRLINRYKLIVANCDNQKLIESLPLSLSYEISNCHI
jgi:hypothetical protein